MAHRLLGVGAADHEQRAAAVDPGAQCVELRACQRIGRIVGEHDEVEVIERLRLRVERHRALAELRRRHRGIAELERLERRAHGGIVGEHADGERVTRLRLQCGGGA